MALVVARPAAAQDASLEDHPLVDRVLAGDDPLEDRLELARLGLRQEADLAEVDAEERDVDLGDGSGGPQERAVATEDDERVGRRQLAGAARRGRRSGPATRRCRAPGTSPTARARELDGGLDRRVVGEADALDRHAPVTSAMRSRQVSAQLGPGGEVDEELAVALRTEDRRGDDVRGCRGRDRAGRSPTTRSRTSRWMAGSRTTPWSVRPLPASNWGLTRATMSAAGGERRGDRPEDLVERDERRRR